MPNERDILIRALRASGSEREAVLAEQILPDAAAAAAVPAPAETTPEGRQAAQEVRANLAGVPQQAAAAALPADIMSLEEIAVYERLPRGSYQDQQKVQAQLDRVMASLSYHAENGAI